MRFVIKSDCSHRLIGVLTASFFFYLGIFWDFIYFSMDLADISPCKEHSGHSEWNVFIRQKIDLRFKKKLFAETPKFFCQYYNNVNTKKAVFRIGIHFRKRISGSGWQIFFLINSHTQISPNYKNISFFKSLILFNIRE